MNELQVNLTNTRSIYTKFKPVIINIGIHISLHIGNILRRKILSNDVPHSKGKVYRFPFNLIRKATPYHQAQELSINRSPFISGLTFSLFKTTNNNHYNTDVEYFQLF